ncbi:MAG: hypothetical protein LBU17_04050 [Treponema sp.]|jgi:hypothetical protein|nr:hypothetical protein [Treponema sp.]
MNPFFEGISRLTLFPDIKPLEETTKSAWNGVGDAFAQAGDNLQEAIKEFAEAHAKADVKRKNTDSFSILAGLFLAFGLGLVGIVSCVYLSKSGNDAGAIVATIGGIAPILIASLANLRSKK